MNSTVQEVTRRIMHRSERSRGKYLERIEGARASGPRRHRLPCSNLAHGMAVCTDGEGAVMRQADEHTTAQ